MEAAAKTGVAINRLRHQVLQQGHVFGFGAEKPGLRNFTRACGKAERPARCGDQAA